MTQFKKTATGRSNNRKSFAIAQEAKNSLDQTLSKLNANLNGLTEEDARSGWNYTVLIRLHMRKRPQHWFSYWRHLITPLFLF